MRQKNEQANVSEASYSPWKLNDILEAAIKLNCVNAFKIFNISPISSLSLLLEDEGGKGSHFLEHTDSIPVKRANYA